MSSDFVCVRPENQIIITILENATQRRLAQHNNHVPIVELPFRKAMKVVSKINFIIRNEWHAMALDGIDTYLADVIVSGLKVYDLYDRGDGKVSETRKCQAVMKKQINEAREKRKKKKTNHISKLYIPSKQKQTGENTATRAMFIVLGLSHIAKENGLTQHTIITEARKWTPVDMNLKTGRYRMYNGFKGMDTLIEHEYVVHSPRSKLYRITDKGFKVYMDHVNDEVQQQLLNEPNNRNRNTNVNRNSNNVLDNNNNNSNNNNYIDLSGYDEKEMLRKALLESSEMAAAAAPKQLQKQSEFNNSNNSNNSNTVQKTYKYICTICSKGYNMKGWYDKHMAKKHNRNNSMNDVTDNINNSNNKPLISRKRRKRRENNDSDSENEIQIVSHPSKKKRKHNRNIIDNDLDKVYNTFSLLCAKEQRKKGNVFYKGKRYKLKLYIDNAEANLKSLKIDELNLLEWLEDKGIDRNNLKYVKLANCDYMFVLCDEMSEKKMINCAIERKRWDDLEKSVLFDGRGVNQKERLKNSVITRKYYLVEGPEGLVRDEYNRDICKQFLKDTEYKDQYMVKYTQSKHKSMDKICNWYFKILSLLNNENGHGEELVLDSFSFDMFQKSQRVNAKKNKKMLKDLLAMGFDEEKCKRALMAVKNESVEVALGHILK